MSEPTHTEILVGLARVEEKLDNALGAGKDHEERIRKLEGGRKWLIGVAAGLGFAVTKGAELFKFGPPS